MSLNWDLTAMQARLGDAEFDRIISAAHDPEKLNPVTDAIIWNMMAIDMGEITEKNIDEVVWRTLFSQAVGGPYIGIGCSGGEVYLTRTDLEAHIGLRTNVATKTREQYLARFADLISMRPLQNPGNASAHAYLYDLAQKAKAAEKAKAVAND